MQLHPRNKYQGHYDLPTLCQINPELSQWIKLTPEGRETLDFSQSAAVKALNSALLKSWYQLEWQLPEGNLCPPIPGRADYIHYLADLLAEDNVDTDKQTINALDIGCGANCIYPLIGVAEYGWRFTGSDIMSTSLSAATQIIQANPGLQKSIRLRRQKNPQAIFQGIVQKGDFFHLTLCNPPFHRSAEQAAAGTQRKLNNLGLAKEAGLNFAGQYHELWCEGGELHFLSQMVDESHAVKDQVVWFTSLVSKQAHVAPLLKRIKQQGIPVVKVIAMAQGNKQSRFIAWSFYPKTERRKRLSTANG